jgi:hypothetical protein
VVPVLLRRAVILVLCPLTAARLVPVEPWLSEVGLRERAHPGCFVSPPVLRPRARLVLLSFRLVLVVIMLAQSRFVLALRQVEMVGTLPSIPQALLASEVELVLRDLAMYGLARRVPVSMFHLWNSWSWPRPRLQCFAAAVVLTASLLLLLWIRLAPAPLAVLMLGPARPARAAVATCQ